MKTIFVTLSRGSLVRNFFRTGVIPECLARGFRVVLLTPFPDPQSILAEFIHPNMVFEKLQASPTTFVRPILQELQRAVVFNDTVRARYRYTIASKKDPSPLLYIPRMYVLSLLRFVPWLKGLVRFAHLYLDPQKEHDFLFKKYRPDAVFSTTPHDDADISVLKGAVRSGVRTVGMPKSWDNLPKILFPVKTDRLFVWGQYMAEQAVAVQGYSPESITITGVPQFDYYADTRHRESYESFCRRHSLDPGKRTILYGSSGADMCDEAAFVELLQAYIQRHAKRNLQMLVRPHIGYRGDASRFARFAGVEGVVVDLSETQQNAVRDNWDTSEYHLFNLYNSVSHAAVCINVASTLTLDSLACGTPVLNLCFDPDPTVDKKRRSVRRLFETGYIKDVLDMRATELVQSETELEAALNLILADPSRRSRERELLIQRFVYKVDGRAKERVVDALTESAADRTISQSQ